jgi:hypothetical protein
MCDLLTVLKRFPASSAFIEIEHDLLFNQVGGAGSFPFKKIKKPIAPTS